MGCIPCGKGKTGDAVLPTVQLRDGTYSQFEDMAQAKLFSSQNPGSQVVWLPKLATA